MHEILYNLPAEALVLDLACGGGSFDASAFPFTTIRADLECRTPHRPFARADAAHLPFRSGVFDAVICNHGLEHFLEADRAVAEMGRVLRRGGAIYLSVPDASTLHDRLYRFVTFGGGHVNRFTDAGSLVRWLESSTGLPHAGTRTLLASFSFLNRRNCGSRLPRRYRIAAWHRELPLAVLVALARRADRVFGTRLNVYGWAFYFGSIPEAVSRQRWVNLCIRCGQAHSGLWLKEVGAVRRRWFFLRAYRCPTCGAENLYADDGPVMEGEV